MSPKYRIIEGCSATDLQLKVQQAINEGWSLLGGLSISYNPHNNQFKYAQAMVTG